MRTTMANRGWRWGASTATLSALLIAAPLAAQSARFSVGIPVVPPTAPPVVLPNAVAPNMAGMTSAFARQTANQAALANARGAALTAQTAAAMAGMAAPATVQNGTSAATANLAAGLVRVATPTGRAPTEFEQWVGAREALDASLANGRTTVTVTQTAERALLSWSSFNIGRETTLRFDQSLNGVAQPSWIALNRVVGTLDAAGRPTAGPAPSQILGSIEAPGTVLVLNQNGVLFGPNSQVNVRGLVASALEIGAAARVTGATDNLVTATSFAERNASFLQSGLFTDNRAGRSELLIAATTFADAGIQVTASQVDFAPIAPTAPGEERRVVVDAGAQLNAASGGFVILTAPRVENAGRITAPDGQVSLVAGNAIRLEPSSGAASSPDPAVRGFVVSTVRPAQINDVVDTAANLAGGLIEAPRGNISIGATQFGVAGNAGVLLATTSVSRNGKITLTGGAVDLASSSVVGITPEATADTIGQGAASVAAFRTSEIVIGGANGTVGARPAAITLGADSLIYAPSANLAIGASPGVSVADPELVFLGPVPSLTIGADAIIDVSGVKEFVVPASRNSIAISPLKRNELRDTPNYREEEEPGGFTLNGATFFVDGRLSGVRADGVAWIGSPLIEASSYLAQVGVTASELMTEGGTITLGTLPQTLNFNTGLPEPGRAVDIAAGATFDISGGWRRFEEGVVVTSRLLTSDGRIVEAGRADPNDNFVGVINPFTETQERFGQSTTFTNAAQQGDQIEAGYTEGRDAGALVVKASTLDFGGRVFADAFAGTQQIARGTEPSVASTLAGDVRLLQQSAAGLPSGGLFAVQALGVVSGSGATAGGADIQLFDAAAGPSTAAPGTILLPDALLSAAGLAQVTLQTSGAVTLGAGASLDLAPNGGLVIDAGRNVTLAGDVSTPSGTIRVQTYELPLGSLYTPDDDLADAAPADQRYFDIIVSGRLSARGRFANDLLVTDGAYTGGAFLDGGSISLTVAPRVATTLADAAGGIDRSGRIAIAAGALLDVSAGAYVSPQGALRLTARGGNVSLVDNTNFFSVISDTQVGQYAVTGGPSGVPASIEAAVDIAPGTIRGHGFAGGGSFVLSTPALDFGARTDAAGTDLPLDFIGGSGFADYTVNTFRTRLLADQFTRADGTLIRGNSAVLETEVARVAAGETLDLSQALLPSLLDAEAAAAVRALASGTDIAATLGAARPDAGFDARPVSLTFGGLTEVRIENGGRVEGVGIDGTRRPTLGASRLLNDGEIRLVGGSLVQSADLPEGYAGRNRGVGVRDLGELLAGDAGAPFNEAAPSLLDPRLTNAELVIGTNPSGLDSPALRFIYFLGALDADEGVRLTERSITDLSGAALVNPRAPALPGGAQARTGALVAGGVLDTRFDFATRGPLFDAPRFGPDPFAEQTRLASARDAATLDARPGARVDLRGASDSFDVETALGVFTRQPQWSAAGRLTAGGGGSIAGAEICAGASAVCGGVAAPSEGGVLEWNAPRLRQSDLGAERVADVLAADAIAAAGFDTFIARRSVGALDDVALALDRQFILGSLPYGARVRGDAGTLSDPSNFSITVTGNADLTIAAPHVRLASLSPDVVALDRSAEVGDATATFRATTIDISGSVYVERGIGTLALDATGDIRLIGTPALAAVLPGGPGAEPVAPTLTGQLLANGDINFTAAQVYATTGTGNLQQVVDQAQGATDAIAPQQPFVIGSAGAEATIRFACPASPCVAPPTPFSAGSRLLVQAADIVQGGVLRAPVGSLTLGSNAERIVNFPVAAEGGATSLTLPATRTTTLAGGGVTSVSLTQANGDASTGIRVPYGTTTDQLEYFFNPVSAGELNAPPSGVLNLAGAEITIAAGAAVDGQGGGDLYAYEFAAGVGGSRDVLSRFNEDPFSSRNGLQFPDGRPVYAIVPSLAAANVALFDPIYSSDYASLYAADYTNLPGAIEPFSRRSITAERLAPTSLVGRTVILDAAPGLPAGEYTLLPARYALLPGGFRVYENAGTAAGAPGTATTLRDGTIVTTGRYGVAGTTIEDSQRRSFTVQNQATFRQFSELVTTSANAAFRDLAARDNLAVPRLPLDAANLVFQPLTTLDIVAQLATQAAPGGRGAQVDITGQSIEIVAAAADATLDGAVVLTAAGLNNLGAESLLLGAVRTDRRDGSTLLDVTTTDILVANDAANPLRGPEIVFATGGVDGALRFADGATVLAAGEAVDQRAGTYVVDTTDRLNGSTGQVDQVFTVGNVARVANAPERLVMRLGRAIERTLLQTNLDVGAATLEGRSVLLDSTRDLTIADSPGTRIVADFLALAGDDVFFAPAPTGFRGLAVTPQLEAQFSEAERLTVITESIIGFTGGTHRFNDLRLDARGLRPYGQAIVAEQPDQGDIPVGDLTAPIAVTIVAEEFRFSNGDRDRGACVTGALSQLACGSTGNTLLVDAREVSFGSGPMRTYGFDDSVTFAARDAVTYEGNGVLDVHGTDLAFRTPLVAERALAADPRDATLQPRLQLLTTADVTFTGTGGVAPAIGSTPGAVLRIGDIDRRVASATFDGLDVRATAGVLDVRAAGDIAVVNGATLSTPAYSRVFGDEADAVRVSAAGGSLSLVSTAGDLALDGASTLSVGGEGGAGKLTLSAGQGLVRLAGTLDGDAPKGRASLTLDGDRILGAGDTAAFDFSDFVATQAAAFNGEFRLRLGRGDLALATTLAAESVHLTADGGAISIAGLIDTRGDTAAPVAGFAETDGLPDAARVNGGDIALWGRAGVALAASAVLDARTFGYAASDSRQARAGDVTLGTEAGGSITVAAGAVIDVRAPETLGTDGRPVGRLIPERGKAPVTLLNVTNNRYVEPDLGGKLHLRLPWLEATQSVDLSFAGELRGAREVSVEAFRRFDLGSTGLGDTTRYVGVAVNDAGDRVTLDLGAAGSAGRFNPLGEAGPGGVVGFVRDFALTGDLGTLAGYGDRIKRRPGVELAFAGDIELASNWNLGAGTIRDVAAAKAAGVLADSRDLTDPLTGDPRLVVVPGREAEFFRDHIDLTYRPGGAVDGDAPVLTLRAAGDLDVAGSITDGFFSFADQTDPGFIDYQLGGGVRRVRPAFNIQCGIQDACVNLFTDFFVVDGTRVPFTDRELIVITGGRLLNGESGRFTDAPFSLAANGPAARGGFSDGSGDPIGGAEVFPLLADGRAVASSDIRLVAGAAGGSATPFSVDPVHVSAASAGDVIVRGERSYRIAPPRERGRTVFEGPLQFSFFDLNNGVRFNLDPDEFLDISLIGSEEFQLFNLYTRVNLANAPAEAREFILSEFAERNYPADQFQLFPTPDAALTLTGPISLIVDFFQQISVEFGERVASDNPNRFPYNEPNPPPLPADINQAAYARNLVRTGTGAIDIAAAGDIDLRNGEDAVYRFENNRPASATSQAAFQVGGSAVYTAGRPVFAAGQVGGNTSIEAVDVATGSIVQVDPGANAQVDGFRATGAAIPSINVQPVTPLYLTGGGDVTLAAGRDIAGRRDVFGETVREIRPARFGLFGDPTGTLLPGDVRGSSDQRWRVGGIADQAAGLTDIRLVPGQFTSGVAALGGGDVQLSAARDLSDLTVAATTSVTGSRDADDGRTLYSFGGGDIMLAAGRNLAGGRLDVASGVLDVAAAEAVTSLGLLRNLYGPSGTENALRIRLSDAEARLGVGREARLLGVGALGVRVGDGLNAAPPGLGTSVGFQNAAGFYTAASSLDLVVGGELLLTQGFVSAGAFSGDASLNTPVVRARPGFGGPTRASVLPATFRAAALLGDLDVSNDALAAAQSASAKRVLFVYPSSRGDFALFAGGDIGEATITVDDGDPALLPGALSAFANNNGVVAVAGTRGFDFPALFPDTDDLALRVQHDEQLPRRGDLDPVRLYAGGDIDRVTLTVAKQARISAGGDIVDMLFTGQHLQGEDITRITAGRDITGTTRLVSVGSAGERRSTLQGNNFVLGGPGALFLEAGRDLGPFLNSATIGTGANALDYAGGVRSVGGDNNPWLGDVAGARIYAQFGVANGADYDALRETYVNPANAGALDGDLFIQVRDVNGNRVPDFDRPIYASALVGWLAENQPDVLARAFGAPVALTAAEVLPLLDSLDAATRQRFLLDLPSLPDGGIQSRQVAIDRADLATPVLITDPAAVAAAPGGQRTAISGAALIGWLAQNAPAALEQRFGTTTASIDAAYAAFSALDPLVQRQFLLDRVYFNELAVVARPQGPSFNQFVRSYRAIDKLFPGTRGYTANIDYSGDPLGQRAATITPVVTGDLDLRLATIETARGGDIGILGPGGRVVAGSIVRSDAQLTRRNYDGRAFLLPGERRPPGNRVGAAAITAIPVGFEGVLSLRGGAVRSYTDDDFLLNQSRLFTLQGGDVTVFSGNGDVNAGQGPRTTASNPPVVLRFDPNGFSEVDSAGAISGAGIAALRPSATGVAQPSVTLIAPVGTVDAGDAGVRAAGTVFVAAAQVANASSFEGAEGTSGVGTTTTTITAATSGADATAAAQQVANAVAQDNRRNTDSLSRITVEVLGFGGDADDDPCAPGRADRPANCPPAPTGR